MVTRQRSSIAVPQPTMRGRQNLPAESAYPVRLCGAGQDILQLTHIARPRIVDESLNRFYRASLKCRAPAVSLSQAAHDVFRREGEHLLAVGESDGRLMHTTFSVGFEKVFSKSPFGDLGRQIVVSCGNRSHVSADRFISANAVRIGRLAERATVWLAIPDQGLLPHPERAFRH